tara:strand:+ start:45 stop:296 length:252 start_codon:yes stop_codon:yes gene_type:complete
MDKPYDDSNWRNEYIDIKSTQLTKRQVELLEKGPHSLSQAWLLGALHNDWKRIKGYEDPDTENKGQCQSSLKEFYSRYKDQGI